MNDTHPLVESETKPDRSAASAPEAAEWLKNPTAILTTTDQIKEWCRKYEEDPENCPPLFDDEEDDDDEDQGLPPAP